MGSISENITRLKASLPNDVSLVAVSKTKPVADIMEAYNTGHRHFGENKIQEMANKAAQMPSDIEWHMIGHVQRNKVKYMAPFVSMIHGVDSVRVLLEINKQAAKHQRVIPCLLQIRIAREETKFGMSESEAKSLLENEQIQDCKNISVVGLMGMATFTKDKQQLAEEFGSLKNIFDSLKKEYPNLSVLSMGMSDDYPVALSFGSNMIRVGSAIFGPRVYP